MAALDFPSSPTLNQQYPSPPVSGQPVYTWDGEKWTTKGGAIGSTGASDVAPLALAAAGAAGSSTLWSRGDHQHPAVAPTPATDDNSTKIATTAFVAGQGSVAAPLRDALTAAQGASIKFARQDHAHPSNFADSNVISGGYDLNNLTVGGRFLVLPTVTNCPAGFGSYAHYVDVQLWQISPLRCRQVAAPEYTSGESIYHRICHDGTWTAWQQIFDPNTYTDVANFRSNSYQAVVGVITMWAAAAPVIFNDAATITPDFSAAIDFFYQLTVAGATRVLANPTNIKSGQKGLIYLQQDGTGNRTISSWGSYYKFPGGVPPTLSTAANAVDVVSFAALNANWLTCTFSADHR